MRAMRIDWLDLALVPGLATATGRLGMTGIAGAVEPQARRRHRPPRPLRRGPRARLRGRLEHRGHPRRRGHRTRPPPDPRHGRPARSARPSGSCSTRRAAAIEAGETVVIACFGGFGRTGTAVSCLLIDAGLTADEAIALTRETRPGTIEGPSQLDSCTMEVRHRPLRLMTISGINLVVGARQLRCPTVMPPTVITDGLLPASVLTAARSTVKIRPCQTNPPTRSPSWPTWPG